MSNAYQFEEKASVTDDSKDEKFQMKKRVGFLGGVAITIGTIVGSGIFISPIGVLRSVHGNVGLSLIIWIVCGIIAMMSALCYCELGSTLKMSGIDFSTFKLAYGAPLAFMYSWTRVMIDPGGAATLQVFASYLVSPFYTNGCTPSDNVVKLFAILLLCVIFYLNCISVKTSVKLEMAFSLAKFLAMVVIGVTGIVHLGLGNPVGLENFQNAFSTSTLSQVTASDVGLAVYQGYFSYSGYAALCAICEEMKDVKKDLPRVTILSLSAVVAIYLFVNIGYFSVLTIPEIISSKAVALTFANAVLGPFAFIMPLSVCFSTMGNQNGAFLLKSRIPFVAGRAGLMPKIFSMIHIKYFTPTPALTFQFVITNFYILVGDFDTLIQAFGFINWAFYGLSAAGLLIIRKKFPNINRPYKVPIVIPIFVCVASIFFIVVPFLQNPPIVFFYVVGFYVIIFVCYFVFIVKKLKIPGIKRLTIFLQKLMQCAETDWNGDGFEKKT